MPRLVSLLDEYGIPITWATVGHLFLEKCARGINGLAHPQMPRPPVMTSPPAMARWTGDWYAHDPCTDYHADGLWYCPDLIHLILESKVSHELGSHSFSHISFFPENSTPVLVEHEMAQCQAAMSRFGVTARSLVYPYNHMGHHYAPVLARHGITCVRHRDLAVRLSYPERLGCGVYKLYESMNFRSAKHYSYPIKAEMFLEAAIKRHAAFHLWFHPSDPLELFQREFKEILRFFARLRDRGMLWIATMGDLAAYCEAREQTTLEVRRQRQGVTIRLRCNYDMKRYGQTALTLRVTERPLPKACSWHAGGKSDSFKWKNDTVNAESNGGAAFLVDVPAASGELRVLF